MTADSRKLSMRADLIRRRVWMGDLPVWVVKDPLSLEFYYFSDQEYEILTLADGQRSLSDIASACAKHFAPQFISSEALVRFFADAGVKGLVVVDGASLAGRANQQERRRRWWRNPLAIRLPGFNPDRLLDSIGPYFKPIFSPATIGFVLLLIIAAIVIAVTNIESLGDDLATATRRLSSGDGWVMLLVVISLTKIIHEFAHAFACKCFGGECREMGVMFLVGVPCLYCDVSDAWLLDRRWKRILISAAGMLAELALAAFATLIWLFALDGPVRDICVSVMVVCSITTVLFNGNPLLRYDGYFILSDLAGIPNLANESAMMIRGWFRRFLWATPVPRLSMSPHAVRRNAFVVCYGIASGLYRFAVYSFILLMLYRFAESYELGGPVGMLGLFAIGWFCFKWVKSILTPPQRSIRRASMTTRRPALLVSVAASSVVLISLIPLPRSVVAPMSIQPAGARAVFVAHEGAMTDSLGNGVDVVQGQVIARLLNPQIDRELAVLSSQCDCLAAELESLHQRRSSDRQVSSRIPAVEKALEEAVKRKNLQTRAAERLTLRSPQQGHLFAPPRRRPTARKDHQPEFWTGTPMEPENRGIGSRREPCCVSWVTSLPAKPLCC